MIVLVFLFGIMINPFIASKNWKNVSYTIKHLMWMIKFNSTIRFIVISIKIITFINIYLWKTKRNLFLKISQGVTFSLWVIGKGRLVKTSEFEGLTVCSISFNIHGRHYNFLSQITQSKSCLNVFIHKFVPTSKKIQIKWPCSITNFQPPLVECLVELADSRSVYNYVFCKGYLCYKTITS